MGTDCAFQIGKTHDICEDYALASDCGSLIKDGDNITFAIVSDGCSSSRKTDIGSRVLSSAAVEQLNNIVAVTKNLNNFNANVCISKARDIVKSLSLPTRTVDATLLMATVSDCVQVKLYGDGFVAIGLDNGDIFTLRLEYHEGYPFYLNYLPESGIHFQNWKNLYSQKTIHTSIISNGEIIRKECFPCTCEYFDRKNDKKKPAIYITGDTFETNMSIDLNSLKWVTLISDGVDSFYKTEEADTSLINIDIDYNEVISEALNFKNFNGKFMQRRLNRFLKFCQKNNWHHADDISFSSIYFGDK